MKNNQVEVKKMKNNQVEVKKMGGNGHKSNWLTILKDHLTDLKGAGWTDENLTTIDGIVDTILADTAEIQVSLADGGFTDLLIDAIKAETALIVADTNEIQVSLADGGFTDLLIDAIKAETALIVADTGELQTDWANGGRLDAILDLCALEATLTAIKGAGWVDENLVTIDGIVDTINGHITADYGAAQKGVLDDWVDAGRLDAIIDLILADTDAVQVSLADGGFTDLLIDAIKAETALIVADTNELQTDWADGGRLDLLIDAIKAITDTLTLAALEAEAVDALESFDLDHLINVAHPTGDPVADSLIDLIMNKGAGQTFDRATDSLEALQEAIAGMAGVNTYMEQIPDTDFSLAVIDDAPLIADPPNADAENSVVDIDANAGDTFVLRSLFVNITSFGTTGGTKLTFSLWVPINGTITEVDSVDVSSLGFQNLMDLFGLQEVHGDSIHITVVTDATDEPGDAACEGTYRYAKAT